MSSTPSSRSVPLSWSPSARFSAVCPPSVGKSASGRSRTRMLSERLRLEWLDVGPASQFRIGHDGGRVRVDEHYVVADGAQGFRALRARIVELTSLSNDDGA